MDTKDINISKSEEEALKIMEDTSSVTSGQIQSLKEDEECMQICSDMAELTIEMQKAKNTLVIDIQKELADFHRKHSEDNKHRKNTSLFWISFAGVAATVIVVLVLRGMLFSSEPEHIQVFQAKASAQEVTLQVDDEKEAKPLEEIVQTFPSTIAQVSSKGVGYRPVQTENKETRKTKVQNTQIEYS